MHAIAQKWHVLYTYRQQPNAALKSLMLWRNGVDQDSQTKTILGAGLFSSKSASAFWRHAEEYLAASGMLCRLEEAIEKLELAQVKFRAMPVLEIGEQFNIAPNDNDMAVYITTAISPMWNRL